MVPLTQPYRPSLIPRRAQPLQGPRMGNVGSLTITDWALLLGGTVVAGAGVNGVINQFRKPKRKKLDAVALGLGIVFALVGGSVLIDEGKKALA